METRRIEFPKEMCMSTQNRKHIIEGKKIIIVQIPQ